MTSSPYNPLFKFDYNEYEMNFTSVLGHLTNNEFVGQDKKDKVTWELKTIKPLFKTEIVKTIENKNLENNLHRLGK
jgi:hypothetical protein